MCHHQIFEIQAQHMWTVEGICTAGLQARSAAQDFDGETEIVLPGFLRFQNEIDVFFVTRP